MSQGPVEGVVLRKYWADALSPFMEVALPGGSELTASGQKARRAVQHHHRIPGPKGGPSTLSKISAAT